jgi:hypothetical protein
MTMMLFTESGQPDIRASMSKQRPRDFREHPPTKKEAVRYRRLLERVGRALYGKRWKSEMGRAVAVNLRTVRRWDGLETVIQPDLWPRVLEHIDERIDRAKERRAEVIEVMNELKVSA